MLAEAIYGLEFLLILFGTTVAIVYHILVEKLHRRQLNV
jgi:hypothetical protein